MNSLSVMSSHSLSVFCVSWEEITIVHSAKQQDKEPFQKPVIKSFSFQLFPAQEGCFLLSVQHMHFPLPGFFSSFSSVRRKAIYKRHHNLFLKVKQRLHWSTYPSQMTFRGIISNPSLKTWNVILTEEVLKTGFCGSYSTLSNCGFAG